jgi:hypothetical protein
MTPRRWRRWLLLGAFLAAAGAPAHGDDAPGAPYLGLSLPEALHRLQEQGLRIVFSSDLVRPNMRVDSEPESRWPRAVLDEILAPHGLACRPGPGDVLLIVKAPAAGGIAGIVRDRTASKPIAGVRVRVAGGPAEGVTDAAGRFRIGPVPPGRYTVEASHRDYVVAEVRDVPVVDGRDTELDVAMAAREPVRERVVVQADEAAARRRRPRRSATTRSTPRRRWRTTRCARWAAYRARCPRRGPRRSTCAAGTTTRCRSSSTGWSSTARST